MQTIHFSFTERIVFGSKKHIYVLRNMTVNFLKLKFFLNVKLFDTKENNEKYDMADILN